MVICPQCNIEHDPGEEFCRKCGKFLLAIEEPSPEGEKTKVKLICSRCQILYKKGNYCRKCGSLLMEGLPPQVMNFQSLNKKSVKKCSKEWLRLLREEKELESCMSNLESQRERVSSDTLHPIFILYKDRLESLSPLHQEIEMELESVRKRASEEIDFLEKELKPIQKRLEEFRSLYKLGAITQADFVREKKELKKEIKSIERSLKKYQQILSLLPGKRGGNLDSPGSSGIHLRPFTLLTASAIILLIIAGGYFFWQKPSSSSEPTLKAAVTSPSLPPSPQRPPAVTEDQEVEKIKSLFENIKQANLKKNINLFMSCYSRDFNDREGKRLDALETWGLYNYHDLSYDLKEQTISGDTANVRLEWMIRVSQKVGGKREDKRTLQDVTLKREDGSWKIKEIKTSS
jgi:ketosteroid isomerase-like protein/ribosomal protein L40E